MKRRFFFTLALLSASIPLFSQSSILNDYKLFKAGAGLTGYMNNLFLPSGMTGINLSSAYSVRNIRKIESHRVTAINDFSVLFDYSRLTNRYGEKSLKHPTDMYNITFYADELFPIASFDAISLYAGPNAGFNAGLCLNNYFTFRSLYYTPFYNEWNVFFGMSLLIDFKLKNLTFENKFTLPCFLFGRWPEYGKSPETRNLRDQINSTKFNTLAGYFNPENHLSVYYSGLKISKKPVRIFFSYSLVFHSSDIDRVIQKFNRNTLYIGLIINKKQ